MKTSVAAKPGGTKSSSRSALARSSSSRCRGTRWNGNESTQWTIGELNGAPPRIAQHHTEAVANGRGCQHVLSAVSRVVIEVQACGQGGITNQAGQMADQMAA